VKVVRAAFPWIVEALVAGLLLGCGARVAMRVLSWLAGTSSGFSTGGSIEIVALGMLLGAPLALGVFALRRWRRWSHPWVGLWTSLGVFLAMAARPSPSAQSAPAASPHSGPLILLVFGALFTLFGLWIDVRWHRRSGRPAPLALRSGLAALLMPGIVAGVVPQLILRGHTHRAPTMAALAGYGLAAAGLALLLACIIRFAHEGGGTLAPYDPPRALVARGAYRFTRNPMYVGVLAILGGLALATLSPALLGYAMVVALCFYTFVVTIEEPSLERQFGDAYRAYKASVPRWLVWRARG